MSSSNLKPFIPVALFGVMANVPFWLASRDFGLLQRGLFNVEYLLLGVACLFLPRAAAPALLLAAIAVDLLSGVSVTYLFTASEALHAAGWVTEFAPSHHPSLARVGLAVLVSVLLSSAAYQPSSPVRRRAAAILAALLLFAVAFDIATGKTSSWRTDRQLGSFRLSRTPLHALWATDVSETEQRKNVLSIAERKSIRPSSALLSTGMPALSASIDTRPNVVLVLLESWGQPADAGLRSALLQPYAEPALRNLYSMRGGTVSFRGPTINGESRELCGSNMGLGLLAASSTEFRECLPAVLERGGYRTIAVHGFGGRMYGRRDWWKTIGFDELWFREQFAARDMPVCSGGFPGICDASLAEWLGLRLQEPSTVPRFFYWVTLSSHLPVPIPNRVEAPPSCSIPLLANATLCSWYQLVFNVHRSVAALALHPSQRPTTFLIVGDHRPPFASQALRDQFSDQVVPYILLTPREMVDPTELSPTPVLISRHHPPRHRFDLHP